MKGLKGKRALVTGGAAGIGAAIVQRFVDEGASVVVFDLKGDPPVDITDYEAVRKALAAAGPVDILVNNAGASIGNDLRTIEPDIWDRNFAIVLKSAYLCTKAALPGMIAKGKGSILNIASVNGLMGLGEEAYSAAKAGMVNLTQNTAIRYGAFGVRANCIAPGTVETPIWAERVAINPTVFEELAAWYPLGRVGQPEDIAHAALFLASDAAAWITGVVLPVDGGLTAGAFRMARELSPE